MSQVLGFKRKRGFKTWEMYRGHGRDICRVRFQQFLPNGTVIDRRPLEVLDYQWETAPRSVKFMADPVKVARAGRLMCNELGRAETDLRVTGECGSLFEWRPLEKLAGRNLCEMTDAQIDRQERRRGRK